MVKHHLAKVYLWGDLIGVLADSDSGICAFEYTPQWIAKGIEISPIHLPLNKQVYSFPSLAVNTYKGLPAAFTDTLPDDFGNAVINAWLAREGMNIESFSSIERLLYTGKRGMGALEYQPTIGKSTKSSIVQIDSLIGITQEILDNRGQFTHSMASDKKDALTAMLQVGTSAGGARPKAVIGINKERSILHSGQVDLPKGFEHYLLKFDGVVENNSNNEIFGDPQGYGRMEYAYYKMAKAAGIEMMPSELLEEVNRAHFMTKRFDRIGNKKVHFQSLCAMDHADFKRSGEYSYEQVFALMRRLRLTKADALEMYRRMVFNIVARNHDDHSKNIGFILNAKKRWVLSPAYDMAFSYRKDSPWVNAHQLSLNGLRDNFKKSDLFVVASTFRKEAEEIVEQVNSAVSQWEYFAKDSGVEQHFSQKIKSLHCLF